MSDNLKNKIISISFMFLLVIFLFANTVRAKDDVLYSERRLTHKFPELKLHDIISKTGWTERFENYLLDHFLFRDSFRRVKAKIIFDIYMQKDNNRIYEIDGYVFKIEKEASDKSLILALDKFMEIYENYLHDNKIYFTFIPDKSYYLSPEYGYPVPDYTKIENLFKDKMYFAHYIDIKESLKLEDYYKSDIHWCQNGLENLMRTLSKEMNFKSDSNSKDDFAKNYLFPFYGGYYGQSALNIPAENLFYLSDKIIENLTAKDMVKNDQIKVYDYEKFHSVDPYSFFLAGPLPLIEITNPKADTDRELIILRDSFASSIAPLIAKNYAKVTLIDIRYIPVSRIGDFVDFSKSEILYMYSFSIIGNSMLFR